MPNRLANESSPYLRQHAENPVDWFAWGEEVLERAKREDRPILLSIGYSACHWCHVMAHESFEDPKIAALMNELFVNIKGDREERPDLDDVYQQAIQLLGRHGGWPLTVFLTPQGVPFFGGTYFPNQDRHGLPAFERILTGVAEAYRQRRGEVEASGRQILGALASLQEPVQPGMATPKDFAAAVGRLLARTDEQHGGFGGAPKFPNTMALAALLRAASLDGHATAGAAVKRALAGMADGGIHDQLGGGFHRYSVDEAWIVPHFEKMLYDNALLASLYLSAWQWSGDDRHRSVAKGIFDYLAREMTSPGGGLYSSQDADSAGPDGHVEEGLFYVWTQAQIAEVVGPALAPKLWRALGVGLRGNFEDPAAGQTVLTRDAAAEQGLEAELAEGRAALFRARELRARPFRDEKVLAGWNGFALSALAQGAQVLADDGLRTRALALATFVRTQLTVEGALRRSFLESASRVEAFAEDYAALAVGFLDLYELTFDPADLQTARGFADLLLSSCFIEALASMSVSPSTGERLVHRPLSLYDNAIPSATSCAVEAFQRLGWLTDERRYTAAAETIVRGHLEEMVKNPFGFGNLLCGLDRHLRGAVEVVIVGAPDDPRTQSLLRATYAAHLPNRLLLAFAPGHPPSGIARLHWEGRENPGVPTAYVCLAGTCLTPVTDAGALPAALQRARAGI